MHKFLIPILVSCLLMAATLGDDGLYDDALFHESFLDMQEDAALAKDEGKILMVVVEQRGCPYCREMHEVNFAKAEIREAIEAGFYPVQLDLWGSREVVDFAGEPMEERDFIVDNNIQFTPTTLFFDENGEELFRMPGYFKPFHHLAVLDYVSTGEYSNLPFQRFLQARFDAMEAAGEAIEVWE